MTSFQPITTIYTDGACSGNPGPGGWGIVAYLQDGSVYEMGDGETATTNNRMELAAAIAALQLLLKAEQTQPVTLFTDSEYVKNGITKWLPGWKRKGWKTSTGKPVLNRDLWETLDQLKQQVDATIPLEWKYVKGHSGNEGNDRCDAIARAFALGKTPLLQQTVAPDTSNNEGSHAIESHTDKPYLKPADCSDELAIKSLVVDTPINTPSVDMTDSAHHSPVDVLEELPREVKVAQLRNLMDTLQMADEIASRGYLITSSELADLMDVNASAVTSRGDNWVWRNWVVSRVRREGNQILWQLERID